MIWNNDYNYLYATLSTIVVALNSITIPFSFSIIADKYKEYLDKTVYSKFIYQDEFTSNIFWSLLCLCWFLLPLFVNIKLEGFDDLLLYHEWLNFRGGYLIVSAVLLVVFISNFIRFSKMIYKYVTNTDEIVFKHITENIDAHLSK